MKICKHDHVHATRIASNRPKPSGKVRNQAWRSPMGWMITVLAIMIGLLPAIQTAYASEYSAKVYATSLNVRSEPAADAQIVGSVKEGAVVTVQDAQYGWLKIQSEGLTGWVAGHYLKKVSESTSTDVSSSDKGTAVNAKDPKAPLTGTVTADSLRIRSGPGTNYDMIGSLTEGNTVTILSSSSGWLKIKMTDAAAGWVSGEYVTHEGSSTVTEGNTGNANDSVKKPVNASWETLKGKSIIVDAGHGGDDPGTIGTTYGTLEKDLNLQTAQYLKDYLNSAGAHVTMTRAKDEKPSLSSRAQLAQSISADAFISIHYNSSPKKVSGTLTFYYSETSDLKLAHAIEKQLGTGVDLKSNGVSYGNFHVLRENSVPSSLVELGFLTHPTDESIVRGPAYQKQAAKAIAQGLADYFAK